MHFGKLTPLLALLLLFTLILPALGQAGDSEDGWDAFGNGDYKTAFVFFKKAAEQGDAEAQYILGLMYSEGEGVPQDYAEAVKWYRKAAEQGYALAQNNLGGMYFNGEGVPQDDVMAYMWWNLSAAQGIKPAAENRDIVVKHMTPEQIAEGQRLSREWKPKK